MGRFEDLVTGAAHGVPTLVVGHDEQDVGALRLAFGDVRETADEGGPAEGLERLSSMHGADYKGIPLAPTDAVIVAEERRASC